MASSKRKVIRTLPKDDNRGVVLEVEAADGTNTILELTSPEAYALPPAESHNRRK